MEQAELTLMRHCPLVTCGQTVKRGERLATSSTEGVGDIHTPIAGTVSHVDAFRIRISAQEGGEVDPTILSDLSGKALYQKLLEFGADLPPLDGCIENLIINGVDAEPGILIRETLLASPDETLECGLETVRALYTPRLLVLAALKGSSHTLSDLPSIGISNQYPAGLDPLVALAVTGREAPDDTVVIGLEKLFHIGRIMKTGLPIMETPVTVDEESHMVPLGKAVGSILEQAGATPSDRDRIILGGILRGRAAASVAQGVDRDTSAVALVKSPAPVAMDTACVGCGECVRRCPARLDPAMITSFAEFGMFDKAEDEGVKACFECGLCGFFCLAHRPMLQYIRFAKNELALAKARTGEEL
jgi:electron transport complex protein RnfC